MSAICTVAPSIGLEPSEDLTFARKYPLSGLSCADLIEYDVVFLYNIYYGYYMQRYRFGDYGKVFDTTGGLLYYDTW